MLQFRIMHLGSEVIGSPLPVCKQRHAADAPIVAEATRKFERVEKFVI
jgi:hypothetical protein